MIKQVFVFMLYPLLVLSNNWNNYGFSEDNSYITYTIALNQNNINLLLQNMASKRHCTATKTTDQTKQSTLTIKTLPDIPGSYNNRTRYILIQNKTVNHI